MQCSLSPTARCVITAETVESTPPERPQMTVPSPTFSRIFFYFMIYPFGAERPFGLAAADVEEEGGEYLLPFRRVGDFRMELERRHHAVFGLEPGHSAAFAARRDAEASRQLFDFVPVAHPDVELFVAAAAREEPSALDVDDRAPVLRRFAALYNAAEGVGQQLHTVAYSEHGDAGLYELDRHCGRVVVKHAARAAGEDDSGRIRRFELFCGRVPEEYFAVNSEFAHAARDELCVLRAAVYDEDFIFFFHYAGGFPSPPAVVESSD